MFVKGKSGNPSGRPKSKLNSLLAKELTKRFKGERQTNEEAIAKKVVEMARAGDKDCIELIWTRMEGKVAQPIQGDITETKRIVLVFPEGSK